jgi:putative Holliday junction resolvase
MRVLAVDVGARRIGLAISDRSRTLARPFATFTVANASEGLRRVVETIAQLSAEDDGLATVVVGMPARLDGSPTEQTARAVEFVNALRAATANRPVLITTEDERLTSREAESKLALRERDWRRRKEKLDAAAAAVFLQDYLDRL